MDIVAQLRQRIGDRYEAEQVMDSAADTIEFLRTEVDRLGESLNKCHEQMMRRTDGPVHGDELVSELLADGRYKVRFR